MTLIQVLELSLIWGNGGEGVWVEKLHEVKFVILDANCTQKWKPIPFSTTVDIRNFFMKLMGVEALVFPLDRTLFNRKWHYKVVVEHFQTIC